MKVSVLTPCIPRRAALALLAGTSLGLTSQAAIDPKLIAADARWAIHADFNALREGALGKELIAVAMQAQKANNESPVQLDIPKLFATLGSLTAYGANFSEKPELIDGALIAQGSPELRKIAQGYLAQATLTTPEAVTEVADAPFETYSISNQVFVGFPEENVILASKSRDQLLRAREVVRGKAPNLSRNKSSPLPSLFSDQPGNPYFVAASIVPPEAFTVTGPQTRILQMTDSGSVAIGELDQKVFARVRLVASSDAAADKLTKILEGLTAVLSLGESSDRTIADFLKSVTIQRANRSVTLSLAYSSERLSEMLKRDAVKMLASPPAQKRAAPQRPAEKVLAEWKADETRSGEAGTADRVSIRTIEGVELRSGATLTLSGKRHEFDKARVDYIEITPAGGGSPLRFEAEHMKLQRYNVEQAGYASQRRIIASGTSQGAGLARFQFPGTDGVYTIKVAYIDEPSGTASFKLGLILPEPPKAEAEVESPDLSRRPAPHAPVSPSSREPPTVP